MKINQQLIYESPNGGKTVYVRKSGSTQKKIYSISETEINEIEINKQLIVWKQILELSLIDKNLAEELNRVKLLFYLKTNGNKT